MEIKIKFYGTGANTKYVKSHIKNPQAVENSKYVFKEESDNPYSYRIVGCNISGTGKQSVEELFNEAVKCFKTELPKIKDTDIELDIRGHSRGGVTAQKFFVYLKEQKEKAKNQKFDSPLVKWMSERKISIKLATGDAYYGPTARGENKKVYLRESSQEDDNTKRQKLKTCNEKENIGEHITGSDVSTEEGTPSSDNSNRNQKEKSNNNEKNFDTLIVLSTKTQFNCTPMMIRNADKIIVTTKGHNYAGRIAFNYDLFKNKDVEEKEIDEIKKTETKKINNNKKIKNKIEKINEINEINPDKDKKLLLDNYPIDSEGFNLINNKQYSVFLQSEGKKLISIDKNNIETLFTAIEKTYKPRRNVIMLLVCEKLKIKPGDLIKQVNGYKNEFNGILEKIKNSKNVKGVFKNALYLFDSPNHIFYHIIHREKMSPLLGEKEIGKFYYALTNARDTCLKSEGIAKGKEILKEYKGKHDYKKDLIKAILDKLNEF